MAKKAKKKAAPRTPATIGKGKKQCPNCEKIISGNARKCDCGQEFKTKSKVLSINDKQIEAVLHVVKRFQDDPNVTSSIMKVKKSSDNKSVRSSIFEDKSLTPKQKLDALIELDNEDNSANVFNGINKNTFTKIVNSAKKIL